MNRICVLALAALSLPFAMDAAAQSVDPAATAGTAAKPAPAASVPAIPPKAAPQKTAAAPTAPAAQKTAATATAAPQATAGMSQQDKMRYCNKEATGKKGAERKTFMKTCLSSRKAA